MNVWLVKLEEPVPLDSDYRPYRTGMLESALVSRGHSVVRWCSDLNHLTGVPRFGCNTTIIHSKKQRYEFISSGVRYKSPISVGRIIDNFLIKLKIKRKAKSSVAPDIIVCSMPTPALCKLSAKLSNHFSVPLVLDCRDYWPEILSIEAKGWKSFAAKILTFKMRSDLRYACRVAHSFVGITEFFTEHLVRYSGRDSGCFDKVFPLGFSPALVATQEIESERIQEYWVRHGVDISLNKKIFYFAGRLNSTVYNAIQFVVDASKIIEVSAPEIIFVMCGSGSHETNIKDRFEGSKNVVFPGEVDAASLRFLRAHSIAALQPIERRVDYQNSYSNKFFEYLSSGLPVFTSLDGISGQKLVSERCGYIYSSAQELVAQVLRFCSDEELRLTMSKYASSLFYKEFDVEIVYSAYAMHLEAIYADSCVSGSL